MGYVKALQLISTALTLGVKGMDIANEITNAALNSEDPDAGLERAAQLADQADGALAKAIRDAKDPKA